MTSHLNIITVVGARHRGDHVFSENNEYHLEAEPTNPFDPGALKVMLGETHVAYVSRATQCNADTDRVYRVHEKERSYCNMCSIQVEHANIAENSNSVESDNSVESTNSVKNRVIQDIRSLCGMSISDAEQTVDLLQNLSREFRDNPGTRMSVTLLFREIVESILDDGNNMRDKGGKRMRCESSV